MTATIFGSVGTATAPRAAAGAMAAASNATASAPFLGGGGPRATLGAIRFGPAAGPLPARTEGAVTIVADVRLDDRAELCRRLPGVAPSAEDTTILIAAWRRWGVDCCRQLLGDFAFAIWDDDAGTLFCGRDVVGARTLYYWAPPGGGFAFASQLAGLLAHPDLVPRLDTTAAVEQLLVLNQGGGRTFFRHVHRLPPGHALTLVDGRQARTWAHTALGRGPVELTSLEDWADGLRAAVNEAVVARLPAAGGVGVHLSGGLDSSAVTAVAATEMGRAARKPVVVSFSASPETFVGGEAPVDGPAVVAMSERFGLEIHHAETDRVSFRDALLMAAPGMMPPSYKTSPVHDWAAGIGVGTVLTGWGGDEAASFNGRSHLAQLLRRGRLLQLGRRVLRTRRPHRTMWHQAVEPNLPDRVLSRRQTASGLRRLAASTAADALAHELGVVERLRRPLRTQPTTLRTQLALLGDGHLVDRIEEWSADATRYGIDYCHPLLDRRVVELALAAPSEAFVHDGFPRWVFRRAMDPYLPKEVAWRRGKDDSWVQQRRLAGWSTVDAGTRAGWSMARARQMVAEGDDLGGTVDLAKLQRRIAEVPEGGYGPGTPITARAPMLMINRATTLAAFLERNRIAVS